MFLYFNRSIMPTKRSRLALEDESCARTSQRVSRTRVFLSQTHMSHPEIAQQETSQQQTSQQEMSRSFNDMEENAGSTEGTSSSTRGSTKGTSSSSRRGRGSAKPWKEWNNGEKKIIGWNSHCQPIEPDCEKLATQLGYFARQGSLFPLSMKCWKEASKDHLELIWKNVKANTNAPDGFKPICFEKIGKSWRSFKNRVKERYYRTLEANVEVRRAQAPSQVEPDQWPRLVSYWGEENTQRVAAQNANNRENLSAYHRTGRTSFPVIIDKMSRKNLPTDKVSVWRETRKRKGKYCIEDGAAGKEETLTRRLSALPPEEQNNPDVRDMIFVEVIGPDGHGRVLCRGAGIRPTSVRSRFSSHIYEAQIEQLRQEAEEREARHKREVQEREMRYQQEAQEREARHQHELEETKADMRREVSETRRELIMMMQSAGISVPVHTPSTSSQM